MLNELRRVWVYNIRFSVFFLVGFSCIFFLLFFDATEYGKLKSYRLAREKATYPHVFGVSLVFTHSHFEERKEIPSVESGNLLTGLYGYLDQTNLTDGRLIYYCLSYNRPFHEPLSEGSFPSKEQFEKEPCLVLGEAYRGVLQEDDRGTYAVLNGQIICRVTGMLEPITEPSVDDRAFLFWDDMPDDAWKDLGENSHYWKLIYSDDLFPEEEANRLRNHYEEWKTPREQLNSGYSTDKYIEPRIGVSIPDYLIRVFYLGTLFLCIITMLLLLYFWAQNEKKNWILMRICGFRKGRLFFEVILRLLYYELSSFVIVSIVGMIVLTSRKQLGVFWTHFMNGSSLFMITMGVFSVICCMVPLTILMTEKPAQILKYE